MKIDSTKIILDTLNSFTTSEAQQSKFSEIQSYVDADEYIRLHKKFLIPTDIKIDVSQFIKEIKLHDNLFQPWGRQHNHLPRYGISLVNQTGKIIENDPINGSLHEWNNNNPNFPLIESDCQKPTPIMELDSLKPLRVFDGHWCRSNILKWHKNAHFKPHIDSVLPSPWLRLWATTEVDNFEIRYNNGEDYLVRFTDIEAGRLYLIDTRIVHDAISYTDDVYQLFLSVLPSSLEIIKEHLCL
jgi:hypothetical protein